MTAPSSNLHPEAVTSDMVEIVQDVGPLLDEYGFHLAGGTALALYFGHRRSVDLDWFCNDAVEPLDLAQALRTVSREAVEVEQIARGTLHVQVKGVRLSFLEYRYPLLASPHPWDNLGCSLLAVDDIGPMKLSAIAQRGSRKDFVDLFALLRGGYDLRQLVELYRKKFDLNDTAHLLYALVYYDDAEKEPMPEMLWDADWRHIKAELQTVLQNLTAS